ncbi:hypothetical protein MKY98_19370 [Paenibacillus sp. FSL M8-0228]|uniref:hypothetical protein n=1 Tax=Paenibacillus sp. FSL M8-0228 TaxID=2921620 RepID=UPI0030F943A1
MCKNSTITVKLCNPRESGRTVVPVDACIAEEIQALNDKGVITLSCCCGHGEAGQITEWENGFGKWRSHKQPPAALIDQQSVGLAKVLGYRPYPYYYADGEQNGVWQIHMKTGCLTEADCAEWEKREELH